MIVSTHVLPTGVGFMACSVADHCSVRNRGKGGEIMLVTYIAFKMA